MSALSSTVETVPARENVFRLTDANTSTEKRGVGREANSHVVGVNGREVLKENGKLQLVSSEYFMLEYLMS